MVQSPSPEDYGTEFQSLSSDRSGMSGLGKAVIVVLALVAFTALGWFGYGFLAPTAPAGEPPLIKADANPVKRRPTDPGGIDPPHQDKTVYDQVAPGQSGDVVEKLLPPPETPITPAQTEEPPDAGPTPEPDSSEMPAPVDEGPADEDAPSAPETVVSADPAPTGEAESTTEAPVAEVQETPAAESPPAPAVEQPAETPPVAEAPAEQAPTQTVTTPPAPAVQAPVGAYRIQIAAMRSPEAAQKAWSQLQKAHGEVLGGLEFFMQRVDLGEAKGVFYRVQGGPLPDRAAASDLCAQLRERSVSCLVVKS